jgi:YVTN family beta-propeller protein
MRDLNHRKGARDGRPIELGAAPGFPIVAEIAVRKGPISGIAATPDGARLVVSNHGLDSVSVIDTDSCRLVETVEGLDEPFAVAAGSADSAHAYVSTVSPAYDSIGVIDLVTNTVVATHPLAFSVSDLAVSPDGRYVYASRNGAGGADIAVLDTATGLVEAIDLPIRRGSTTECVRVSPDGARLYVATTSPTGGQLVTFGRSSARWQPIGTVEIGLPIRDVALSPDGALAYVASCGPDWGAVIDVVETRTAKITGTYKIGELSGILTGLTLSRDGDRAYVVSDDSVTVLCTLTHDVVGTLGVANQPSCVLESPNAKYLYLADYSGTLTVAPVASIVALGTGASGRTAEPASV